MHTDDLPSTSDDGSAGELLPVVYEELRSLASSYFDKQPANHTLQPTALVHEAFLRLADKTASSWRSRAHFFAIAAVAMRQILVSHARSRSAAKRGAGRRGLSLTDENQPVISVDDDLAALDDAMTALAAFDERKAKVVEARYFGGLTNDEVAQALDISRSTVEADWRFARAWLVAAMRSNDA